MLSRKPSQATISHKSDVPDKKKPSKPITVLKNSDRTALQGKLDGLDKTQQDEKKVASELDRVRSELTQTRRALAEQSERSDKEKKALESRVHELKKASLEHLQQIKELKIKLHAAEQERGQLATKQNAQSDLRRTLVTKQDELRTKDRRILELDKSLASEKKIRLALEAKLHSLQNKDAEDATNVRATVRAGEARAQQAQQQTVSLQKTLEAQAVERQQLLDKLEAQQHLMSHVAEQYGKLYHSTVPVSVHRQVKDDALLFQLQNARLHRKLANSEAQVTELALYLRRLEEEKTLFRTHISDLQAHLDLTTSHTPEPYASTQPSGIEDVLLYDICQLDIDRLETLADAESRNYETFTEYLSAHSSQLLAVLIESAGEREIAVTMAEQYHSAWRDIHSERDQLFLEKSSLTGVLTERQAAVEDLRSKLSTADRTLKDTVAKHTQELRCEKENAQLLAETVRRSGETEASLREEIANLTTQLADAEQYQIAFYSLKDEVETLSARTDLAQGEADQLSKINAQILGHCNPAQRIMYVDKIRQELAETKQRLLETIRDNEVAKATNNNLQNELDMYASITVPSDKRIGTKLTRMTRGGTITQRPALAPLNAQSISAPPVIPIVPSTAPGVTSVSPHAGLDGVMEDNTLNMADILNDLTQDDLHRQSLMTGADLTIDDLM